MGSEREIFDLSGPLHLTSVDWSNEHHCRSVAASLVQGVYIIQRDRQENRQGSEALAPPWWKFFHFEVYNLLVDDADSSVFGAIYEFKPTPSNSNVPINGIPFYVIAFRGTLTKGDALSRDLELDIHIVRNGLHRTSRFEIAMQAVRNMVARGNSTIWLTGHSLGAAMAMLAGKSMAKIGNFLQSYLFNPPFFSAPIEKIKAAKVKHGIRIASSLITAGLAVAAKVSQQRKQAEDTFAALANWIPCLFVNPADHICSEYVGYFEHRKKMEDIGAGIIEKLATQHSMGSLFMNAIGKESDEPLHLIPTAYLTANMTPARDFKEAHGIHQWWRSDLVLESKLYKH